MTDESNHFWDGVKLYCNFLFYSELGSRSAERLREPLLIMERIGSEIRSPSRISPPLKVNEQKKQAHRHIVLKKSDEPQ